MDRNEKKNPIRQKMRSFFSSTGFLTNGLWLIGAAFFFGGVVLIKLRYGVLPDSYMIIDMLMSIPWLIVGCAFAIIRKEIPMNGLPSIRGSWAVLQGALGLVVFGGLEIHALHLLIQSILVK